MFQVVKVCVFNEKKFLDIDVGCCSHSKNETHKITEKLIVSEYDFGLNKHNEIIKIG
ncbi:hypothetical protein D3C72_1431120 [compost metagenome]